MVFAKTTLIKEHPMCHYHHLALIEWEKIMFFRAQGKNLSGIAKELGRSKATISRELRRNNKDTSYIPAIAHQQYRTRRKACRAVKKLNKPELLCLVKDKFIKHQWPPEEIAGRLRLEKHCESISYATIYRGIYAGMFDEANLSHGARGAMHKLRYRGKHAIRRGMRSVVEKFLSATSFLLVRAHQITAVALVIGKVTPLQEKRTVPASLRLSTERVALPLAARRTRRTHVRSVV